MENEVSCKRVQNIVDFRNVAYSKTLGVAEKLKRRYLKRVRWKCSVKLCSIHIKIRIYTK